MDETTGEAIKALMADRLIDDSENLIGKTIAALAWTGDDANRLVIGFADRTYAVIGSEGNWGDGYDITLCDRIPGANTLREAEALSPEEYSAITDHEARMRDRAAEDRKRRKEAEELAEYERLRAKFEGR